MKILSLNFLTCAVKACKSSSESYPLHPKDAELAQDDIELNPQLLANLLPRIDWAALTTTAREVRLSSACLYSTRSRVVTARFVLNVWRPRPTAGGRS